MFAASLIVLSNEFSSIYYNPSYEEYVQNAINIMAYCSGTDPQAERLLYILTTFRDVVANRDERLVGQPTRSLPSMAMLRGSNDPIANFFAPEQQQHVSGGQASGSAPQAPPPPGNVGGIPPALSRKNSLVSPAIPPNTVVPFMMHIHSQPHGHGVVPVAVNPVTGAPMTPLLNGVSPTLPAAAVAPGGSLHPSPTMAAAAAALRPGGGTGTGAPSSVDHDTGDSQGATDGEIDFDILWNNWPAHGSGAPGTAGSGAGGGGGVPGPSLDQPPTPSGTHMPGATPLPVTTMAGAFPVAASAGFASAAYHGYATGLATTIAPGPGGGLGLMNMNVPLFPTSDFG